MKSQFNYLHLYSAVPLFLFKSTQLSENLSTKFSYTNIARSFLNLRTAWIRWMPISWKWEMYTINLQWDSASVLSYGTNCMHFLLPWCFCSAEKSRNVNQFPDHLKQGFFQFFLVLCCSSVECCPVDTVW